MCRHQEVVALYFTLLERTANGFENVLVLITDMFCRFTIAVLMKNQTAHTTPCCSIRSNIMIVQQDYILTKGGVFMELCDLYGIGKMCTSPYHPQGNGQCERFNCKMHDMLRKLPQVKKRK